MPFGTLLQSQGWQSGWMVCIVIAQKCALTSSRWIMCGSYEVWYGRKKYAKVELSSVPSGHKAVWRVSKKCALVQKESISIRWSRVEKDSTDTADSLRTIRQWISAEDSSKEYGEGNASMINGDLPRFYSLSFLRPRLDVIQTHHEERPIHFPMDGRMGLHVLYSKL